MPVDLASLQVLVERVALDDVEKHELLALICNHELWEGLEEDQALRMLRVHLRTCQSSLERAAGG